VGTGSVERGLSRLYYRTLVSVLLCKILVFVLLRATARASTMSLFSFGPVPAQAIRASPSEAARRIR
jgi:hypothetical protein